ncbi:diacylglycerol lipase-beta-like isoform X2 [Daphnia pulex]|uniref:diacylglycerol lipase-beta-like isoform X2 n=1 Tax=Daphnia pulex TaxID=6669 RepID=UPI001EE0E86E|nr:diacylglycerol lipase-beta-like isoform X2 [Daphnia pulex]XP_046448704.1 diacylglycerol lipase-beta-like isoform X2 [Daphnia pulex]XP_046448705.1 diacylglycerol lipase-beta-like isoform X2 [Daphnia pulex]
MPGLVAFGRRWEVASDDLVFPCLVESFMRMIWFIVTVVIWMYHAPYLNCEDGQMLQMYLGGVLFILVIILMANAFLIKHSMRGAIMDVRARKNVPTILYIRIILGVPEMAWTVVGSVGVFSTKDSCITSEMTLRVVQGLVIFNWILVVLFFIGVMMVFDPLGHHHTAIISSETVDIVDARSPFEVGFEQRTRIWEWRCKFLCCSCCSSACCSRSGDNASVNDAFGDVAEVLTTLFHDLDLVPSDIAAGLLLLHLRTKRGREELRLRRMSQVRRPITEAPRSSANNVLTSSPTADAASRAEFSPSALSVPPSAACSPNVVTGTLHHLGSIMEESPLAVHRSHEAYDWMNPFTAHIYMKYALGSYGWMWYLAGGCWEGLCTLKKELVCFSCLRRRSARQMDDNCCHCNLAALKTVTQLQEKDIICVSFHNSIYEVPYFVALDHQTSSIVVAIRGTLSGHDALTDLAAMTDPISVEGLPVGWTAHRGMLQSANFVLRQLESKEILKQTFAQYPNYHLVITGHSLGAGAAVLLSILLKPSYPKVRCFSFSPPGGLLSLAAARFTETFCMSVIIGDDLVPRLSLATLDSLKRQMIAELEGCRHPKYRIFLRGCWEVVFGRANNYQQPETTHPLLSETPNNNLSYDSFSEQQQPPPRFQSPTNRSCSVDVTQQLYLPGRILQVEEREPVDSGTYMHPTMYEARWMQREDYNQILVTPRMLKDHTPDSVCRILRGLSNQYESSLSAVETHEA